MAMRRTITPQVFTAVVVATGLTLLLVSHGQNAITAPSADVGMRVVHPARSDRVLFNPGMGLFVMNWGAKEHQWWTEVADIVYVRPTWAWLEPKEGKYEFAKLDKVLNRWRKAGKRVAFRIMHSQPNSTESYVTPKWVFDAGARFVLAKSCPYPTPRKRVTLYEPVIWDPIFLDKYKAFAQALGKHYDGMKGLEFVDIPIGAYGEMWLNGGRSDWMAAGYSDTLFIETTEKMVDIYTEAFPHTRLFVPTMYPCIGHIAENGDVILNQAFEYIVRKGVNLRQDGLSPGFSRWFDPRAKQYNRQAKVLWEFVWVWKDMLGKGWDMRAVMDRALDTGASYLALMGAGEVARLDESTRNEIRTTAKRIGYRFVINEVRLPKTIRVGAGVGTMLPIRISWKNIGCAPCYESYGRFVYLVDAQGKTVFEQKEYPVTPTSQWYPDRIVEDLFCARLPATIKSGVYGLLIALGNLNSGEKIQLGIGGEDGEGRYLLTGVELCSRPAEVAKVPPEAQAGFETTSDGWTATAGMSLTVAPEAAHSGKAGARIEGESRSGWSYAVSKLFPLRPNARYRLSGWMKVLKPLPHKTPCLKVELRTAEDKFIANRNTNYYNLAEAGTWQRLEREFLTTQDTRVGRIALEKMTPHPATATILLDEVELKLISLTAPE